jgi:hypothetical protein
LAFRWVKGAELNGEMISSIPLASVSGVGLGHNTIRPVTITDNLGDELLGMAAH